MILALLNNRDKNPDLVRNSDPMGRNLCYRAEKTGEAIRHILSVTGHFQDYQYTFDSHEMLITFSRELLHPDARYWVFIFPGGTGCDLRIAAIDGWGSGNSCPQIQNAFWQHLLDARPIPYFEVNRK